MTPSDCARCDALTERSAAGEALTPPELSFLGAHLLDCEVCRAVDRSLVGLSGLLDEAPRPPEADVDAFLDLWQSDRARGSAAQIVDSRGTGGQVLWLRWGSAALLATAAAAAVLLVWRRPVATAPGHGPVTAALVSGAFELDGRRAAPGTTASEGSLLATSTLAACLRLEPRVDVCLDRQSELRLSALAGDTRRLELLRGRVIVALEPQRRPASFGIVTPRGTVTAVGTVFSVELEGPERVTFSVMEGAVRVGDRAPLAAGQQLEFEDGATTVSPLEPSTAEVWRALLAPSGSRRWPLPEGASPAPGSSALDQAPDAPEEQPSSRGVPSAAPSPSAADLLERARAARRAGRAVEAAGLYQRLMTTHPRSGEARSAQLSLAELQLSALDNPRAALATFDAYLSSGGNLGLEASYGRVRALRALGRRAEERAAITEFLARYGNSPQAKSLRRRLEEL
jgi:hypothetical protein